MWGLVTVFIYFPIFRLWAVMSYDLQQGWPSPFSQDNDYDHNKNIVENISFRGKALIIELA